MEAAQWTGRKTGRLHTFICDATTLFGKLSDGGVSEHARHESRPEPIRNERDNVGMAQRGQQFLVAGWEGGRGLDFNKAARQNPEWKVLVCG